MIAPHPKNQWLSRGLKSGIKISLTICLWWLPAYRLVAGAQLDQPETWPTNSFENWQAGRNYNPESGWLSVSNGALALNFPAGPGGASPPVPFSLAFIADTNSSGGRFTGNLAAAGATHLEFDFYGEYTPGASTFFGGGNNLTIELFRADYGTQGLLFRASFAVMNGWQRVIVPLSLDYFDLHPGMTNQYAAPYDNEFTALMNNLSRIYIRVPRSTTRSDAPAEQYRIDHVVLVQNNARSAQTITFPPLADQVTTNRIALNASASSGLPVSYAVNGPAWYENGELRFTTDGTVSVVATQPGGTDFNPALPAVQSFAVTRATALVTLSGLQQIYDGQPRAIDATTEPADLSLVITYDGSSLAPLHPGNYSVHATVSDPAWSGSSSGMLTVQQIISSLDAPSAAGARVIRFYSSTRLLYTLEASTDLSAIPAWSAVPGVSPRHGVDGWDSMADTNVPPHGLFYRLQGLKSP